MTFKNLSHVKVDTENSKHYSWTFICKINGYIEKSKWNKYLSLAPTEKKQRNNKKVPRIVDKNQRSD